MNSLVAVLEKDSLFGELWQYVTDKYFTPKMGQYENLNFGTGTLVTINTIVFGLMIGFVIAAVAVVIDKKHLGDFVRSLIANKCNSPESAMTLGDLEYYGYSIRNAVRRNTALRRVVKCREEEEYYTELGKKRAEYEEKRKSDPSLPYFNETKYQIDLENDCFYIPEDLRITAELKFDKKGTSWKGLLLVLGLSVLLCAFLIFIIPEMLQLLDNFIGGFNENA